MSDIYPIIESVRPHHSGGRSWFDRLTGRGPRPLSPEERTRDKREAQITKSILHAGLLAMGTEPVVEIVPLEAQIEQTQARIKAGEQALVHLQLEQAAQHRLLKELQAAALVDDEETSELAADYAPDLPLYPEEEG